MIYVKSLLGRRQTTSAPLICPKVSATFRTRRGSAMARFGHRAACFCRRLFLGFEKTVASKTAAALTEPGVCARGRLFDLQPHCIKVQPEAAPQGIHSHDSVAVMAVARRRLRQQAYFPQTNRFPQNLNTKRRNHLSLAVYYPARASLRFSFCSQPQVLTSPESIPERRIKNGGICSCVQKGCGSHTGQTAMDVLKQTSSV